MFGTLNFNRSPFNRAAGEEEAIWRGLGRGTSTAEAELWQTAVLSGSAAGSSRAWAGTEGSNFLSGGARGVSNGRAVPVRVVNLSAQAEGVSNGRASGFYIAGTDVLHITDVAIPAGAEIVIDTERQTLTIGGNNAVYALTDDSRFFSLVPGDLLTISGTGSGDITVLWKDRWQ